MSRVTPCSSIKTLGRIWPGNSTNNARFACKQLLVKQVVVSISLRLGEPTLELVNPHCACVFIVHHAGSIFSRSTGTSVSRRRREPLYLALAFDESARTSQYKPPREGELSCLALPPSARFFSPNHHLAQNRRTGGPRQLCTMSGPLTPPWARTVCPTKAELFDIKNSDRLALAVGRRRDVRAGVPDNGCVCLCSWAISRMSDDWSGSACGFL
jgi:hypothetical protein